MSVSKRPPDETELQAQQRNAIKIRRIGDDQQGIRVLFEPQAPVEANIDIVAIHGIGANPDWTWQYQPPRDENTATQERPINWLSDKDMLPKALPNARIMRHGYDSTWYGPHSVKQRPSHIAISILDDLEHARRKCTSRPLLFIGHCFGGIVMQKAYLVAKANPVDYPGIAESTIGMVFLGTPHRGTSGTALHKQGAIFEAISAAMYGTQTSVLQALEQGDEMLESVVTEFTRTASVLSPAPELFCFYEQKETHVGQMVNQVHIKEFIVDKHSGTLDGVKSRGLNRDHFNLNKFTGVDDRNYLFVKRVIEDMASKVQSQVQTLTPSLLKKQAVLKFLGGDDQTEKSENEFSKYSMGSRYPRGEWLVEDAQFVDWKTCANSFLWLQGAAGAGKTVLSENVISHLKNRCSQSKDAAAVVHFRIQDNDMETWYSYKIILSLLHQFYEALYLDEASRDLEVSIEDPAKRWGMDGRLLDLKKFISRCTGGAYVVIDGLDESPCSWKGTLQYHNERSGGPRPLVFDLLRSLRAWGMDNLHLFLSSRPEADITAFVEDQISANQNAVKVINMEDIAYRGKIGNSIGSLIDATLSEPGMRRSCLRDPLLAKRFKDEVVRKADNIIFYADMQLLAISEAPPLRVEELEETLNALPVGLYDSYERALQRIPKPYIKLVRRLLVWLVVSDTLPYPLTIEEGGEIIRIPLEAAEQIVIEPESSPAGGMLNLEGGLTALKVIETWLPGLMVVRVTGVRLLGDEKVKDRSIVTFRHISFRQYLLSDMIKNSQHPAVRELAVDMEKSRSTVAILSYLYLMKANTWWIDQGAVADGDALKAVRAEFPLVGRAVVNATHFYGEYDEVNEGVIDTMKDFILPQEKPSIVELLILDEVDKEMSRAESLLPRGFTKVYRCTAYRRKRRTG